MERYGNGATFTFRTRMEADKFIKDIKGAIYKYDVVTVNDVLRMGGRMPTETQGLKYGYAKKDVKNVKAIKDCGFWMVTLPPPGKMVRDINSHWTTEAIKILEDLPDKGGG